MSKARLVITAVTVAKRPVSEVARVRRRRRLRPVSQSRHDGRRQLENDVRRLGADGVVIATMEMEIRERDCPETAGRRDHIVEATLIGTAIARFAPAGPRHDRPALAIMSLDPQRRQAARIRV